MSLPEIEKELVEMIAMIMEMEEDELWENRDMNFFEDLGMDSLLALEIIAAVEKRYKIEMPEERLEEIVTLSTAIALVKSLIGEKYDTPAYAAANIS